jgi:hypothetical protein
MAKETGGENDATDFIAKAKAIARAFAVNPLDSQSTTRGRERKNEMIPALVLSKKRDSFKGLTVSVRKPMIRLTFFRCNRCNARPLGKTATR